MTLVSLEKVRKFNRKKVKISEFRQTRSQKYLYMRNINVVVDLGFYDLNFSLSLVAFYHPTRYLKLYIYFLILMPKLQHYRNENTFIIYY